jgi:hypothetical protein
VIRSLRSVGPTVPAGPPTSQPAPTGRISARCLSSRPSGVRPSPRRRPCSYFFPRPGRLQGLRPGPSVFEDPLSCSWRQIPTLVPPLRISFWGKEGCLLHQDERVPLSAKRSRLLVPSRYLMDPKCLVGTGTGWYDSYQGRKTLSCDSSATYKRKSFAWHTFTGIGGSNPSLSASIKTKDFGKMLPHYQRLPCPGRSRSPILRRSESWRGTGKPGGPQRLGRCSRRSSSRSSTA